MNDYLAALRRAILATHGAHAAHVASVPVKEVFRGQTAWDGVVEVFDLKDHPRAKRCYAWGYRVDDSESLEITAVLEINPVTSPETAVKVAIAAQSRQKLKGLHGG